jgi:hypothetical protein
MFNLDRETGRFREVLGVRIHDQVTCSKVIERLLVHVQKGKSKGYASNLVGRLSSRKERQDYSKLKYTNGDERIRSREGDGSRRRGEAFVQEGATVR